MKDLDGKSYGLVLKNKLFVLAILFFSPSSAQSLPLVCYATKAAKHYKFSKCRDYDLL